MIKRKLHAPVAAAVAATMLSLGSGNAVSAIVCDSLAAPITVPQTLAGLYINFVTDAIGTNSDLIPGWDFNAFGTTSFFFYFWYAGPNYGLLTGTDFAPLPKGVPVGPEGTYDTTGSMAAWQAGVTDMYEGIQFDNEATAATNYAWVQLTTTGPIGIPATVNHYCYQNDGTAIMTGDVATLPVVATSFAPVSVQVSADSTATITLSNQTMAAATLIADLADTLPAGLVATAASAATTCVGGAASSTASSITLGTGAVIPANGSCTITATVHSAAAGSYTNTIPVGAVQTSIGNTDTAASATLTVLAPPAAVVTPAALSFTLHAGSSGTNPLNVANTGGSDLTYVVSEGATSIHRPTSYKTGASRAERELLAKFGPVSIAANPFARNHATGQRVPLLETDISQMADNSPGDQGVSCNDGTSTTANSWWRRFYFSEYPAVGATTDVSSVTISSGSMGPAGVPVTINLYTIPHGTPVDTIPTASLTPIGSGTGTIDSGLLSVTIPVSGAVTDTAGTDLVVEYHIDAIATGTFFPGANSTAETHPTFMSAADCGIPEPTPAIAIGTGFPDFHMTMVVGVNGSPPLACANPVDVPWLSETPPEGTVAAGANTNVTVAANATGMTPGSYSANVCVATNDPNNALVTLPATLTVTPAPFVRCSGGADEVLCDGFDGATGGTAGTYTDRTTFLTHVAPGFFENAFNEIVASSEPEAALHYTDAASGIAYTIDSPPTADDLWFGTGIISTDESDEQLTVTFTGTPVTAVGGNFYASDIDVLPIVGNQVVITLSDGTTETFNTAGDTDFRGFTTPLPITSITIDAPNPSDPTDGSWATMDNLIIGTGN